MRERKSETRRRWGLPVPRSEIEREVLEELHFHLEKKAERLVQQGFSPAEARAEAERRFGGLDAVRRQCIGLSMGRERKRMRLERLGDLWRDLRYSVRALLRRPGFTVTAVLTIALGLGAVTSIFSLLDAVLLRALPYGEPDRLTVVWGPFQSEAVYLGLEELPAFESLAAVTNQPLTLTGDGEPRRVQGSAVTANFFDLLRVPPKGGRSLTALDAEPGADLVAVISERLATERFGSVERATGQSLRLEGRLYQVVGVAPDSLRLPNADTELWLPLEKIEPSASGYHWGNYHLQLIGRLADGFDRETARHQVRNRAKSLRRENPVWTPGQDFGDGATVDPLQANLAGSLGRLLRLLMVASFAVLLVACVNVANLLLARSSARERETAIRSSVGAGRGRLLTSLLLESLVISLLGAAVGLAVAFGSLRLLTRSLPAADARFGDIGIDHRVLLFTLAATVVTALLFGLLPAWRQSRADLAAQMAAGARGGGRGARKLSRGLVVVQLALSVLLLFSAGLVLKSLWKLWNVEPGFEGETVLLARLDPSSGDYQDPDRRVQLYRQVIERLEASPMVVSAAASSVVPMGSHLLSVFDAPSRDIDPNDLPVALNGDTTPGFFETVGLPLLRGRDFTDQDARRQCTTSEPCATIVNQTLADRIFDGEPLGEVIGAGFLGWFEIVGVSADARLESLSAEPTMAFFLPHAQRQSAPQLSMELLIRAATEPRALESLVRETVRAVDPQVPVDDVRTLDSLVRGSVNDTRFLASLLVVFAAVSLLLGAIGVYGVISYMIDERRHELGVRAAMGATPGDLRHQVLWQAVGLAVLGVLLGCAGIFGVARLLETQLYETSTREVEVLLSVPLTLLAAAALSAWLPARRAARVDPVVTLREE